MGNMNVLIEKKGKIAYVIFNRSEKLNAFNRELLNDFEHALDELQLDKEISVLIIKGSGRAFSVGYDVGEYDPDRKETVSNVMKDRELLEGYMKLWIKVWEYPKPVIAQVHGFALAGGTQLCSCCDVVVAAEDAQFGFPTIPLGGGFVGPMWLWHVGYQRAKLMDLTAGSRISGKEAVNWGFAAKCFPGDQLEEETLNIARGFAKTPLDILELKKKAFNRIMELHGFRTAAFFGPDQDAIIHTSGGVKTIGQKIEELGLRGAIEWFNNQTV